MSAEGEISRGGSDVTVRRLTTSDIPAVSAILSESPDAAAWSQDSLCQLAPQGFHAWVAEQAAGVAGFLIGRIAGDEFEILNLAVARTFRRCGIASKLLESALEFSRIAGSQRVYLEVRASNEPAVGLYTRHGFTKCGMRTRYYRNPAEDALLFSRHIGGTP
ncbi:MAG: ribosomal protein S18-alanine N-acetyltransferase [Acidobacteriia bacterium]|nr:ribosomal protein S18-alanine N-acetyltransferase [Terriglobia bacterium]